jgi:hypothetical protein
VVAKPPPTAMHSSAVEQDTPESPAAKVGTTWETQVCAPSDVVSIERTTPPRGNTPPPTATQCAVVTHETAVKKLVSEGSVSEVQCAPPSTLVQI